MAFAKIGLNLCLYSRKSLAAFSDQEKGLILDKWLNVLVEKRTDWKVVWLIILIGTFVVGSILSVILIWNRRMAKEMVQRKRAEERFQAIAATTPGAIIQLQFNSEGRPEYLYLSAKAEMFFGMPLKQVIERKERLRWHPEDRKRIHETVPMLTAAGEDLNLVGRIQPEGKETRWIRLNASPGHSSEGELIYNGFILDITERKQAEQEYLRSERKIKAMSQAAEDAMVMVDGEGKVLFWNPAAERLFGFSEAEAMGMDFHQMATPGMYHDKIYKGLKHFAKTGEGGVLGTTTEITARNREGDEFPVEVTISSFQVDDEWFAVGTVRNITERKMAEETLRESQKQFRIIADYTYDWEGWQDADGHLLWVNPAVERISGYSVQECIAMDDYPLPLIHPEDHDVWRKALARALQGLDGDDVGFRVARKDGGEVWVSISWNPVTDDQGEFFGFRTSARDITERKKAEEAMKESERRLKTILETANDGFFAVDNNQKIIEANPAMSKILGREREDITGKTTFDFVDEENRKILLKQIEMRNRGEKGSYEIALSRPDGSQVFCLFNVSPYFDENNEKIGAFAMVTDITARKKGEEELQQNLEDLEKFSSMAIGREEKMIELKEEINELLIQSGKGEKYKIVQ